MNVHERLSGEQLNALPKSELAKYDEIVGQARWQVDRWVGVKVDLEKLNDQDRKDYDIAQAIYFHVAILRDHDRPSSGKLRSVEDLMIDHWVAHLKGEIQVTPLDENDQIAVRLYELGVFNVLRY